MPTATLDGASGVFSKAGGYLDGVTEWLEMDLGEEKCVVGVEVGARPGTDQWATQYKVKTYSDSPSPSPCLQS